jgi:hypothetical protein
MYAIESPKTPKGGNFIKISSEAPTESSRTMPKMIRLRTVKNVFFVLIRVSSIATGPPRTMNMKKKTIKYAKPSIPSTSPPS